MVVKVVKAKTKIGPQHQGHKMSLRAFEFAEVEEGYSYELARGVIVVSEVANFPHARRTAFIRKRLDHYSVENPSRVYEILVNMESKLLIPQWESERHPDISVYLTAPQGRRDRTMWRTWIPQLTIEVVSQ